jgi:CBS domain-containing protein
MSDDLIYASRLVHLPVLGPDETFMGRIGDVVLTTTVPGEQPTVNGFVVEVPPQRRVFVSAGRIAELDADGARVRRPNLNMRTFELRAGEFLAVGELIGRKAQGKVVIDIGLVPTPGVPSAWQVSTVALGSLTLFRRPKTEEVVEWEEVSEIFTSRRPLHRRAVQMNALHPAEMAAAIRQLPTDRRRALAAILEDERLADLLEELPEEEQVRLIEGLDVDRIGSILDEMEADDAADLLGELPAGRRDEILQAMTPDEADPVRRLLSYDPNTAGGLMTPEPVIMAATTTVAEALAAVRNPDLPPALGAQVYVTAPPFETPTGRYLGVVGYQRLLREPPFRPLARCLDEHPDPIAVTAPEREVAARVAFYDVVAVPVTDEAGRLVGAVTIDDVLDAILPEDWREQRIDGRP